jgi:predicted CxxxxCH...CXXCH cytochrome family protein
MQHSIEKGQTMARNGASRRTYSLIAAGITALAAAFGAPGAPAAGTLNSCVTYCHGASPRDAARKASPHFGSQSSAFLGSHRNHLPAAPVAGDCSVCHKPVAPTAFGHQNNVIEMANSLKGYSSAALRAKYDKGLFFNVTSVPNLTLATCSNVNCHFEKKTPVWASAALASPADCGACHGAPPAGTTAAPGSAGSHARHDVYFTGTANCQKCHTNHLAEAAPFAHATSAGHARTAVTLTDPAGVSSGSYSGSGTNYLPSQAAQQVFGSCSNNYCHSTGNPSVAAANLPAAYAGSGFATVAWGSGTQACNSCHGRSTTNGMPDYTNAGTPGSATANSHQKHVTGSAISCNECHERTTKNNTSIRAGFPGAHLNKSADVFFNLSGGNKAASYTPGAGAKTCSNTYCHGGTGSTVTWGGASFNCQDCHGGGASASVADFGAGFWNNGTVSKIQMTGTGSWADTGHGRPTASGAYAGSGNPAANFAGVANFCEWCHDPTIGHNVAGNPFRLRGWSDATWGKNGVCMLCHATGSAGVTVGGVLRTSAANKVGSYHYGAKHSTALSGGQFCWDCHEPHGTGSTNQFMIRPRPALVSDATTGAPVTQSATAAVFALSATPTGTDYAKSAAPFNGICNVCHTATGHYTTTAGDSHNSSTRCISCHAHSGANATTAFTPTGGGDCTSCHASQQGTGTRKVVGADTVLASHHIQAATVNAASCTVCHEQSVFGHQVAGDVAVGLFNQDTGAALTYDGTAATAANLESACNSCHDSNGASRLGANALKPFADSGDNTAPPFIGWSTGKQAHGAALACFNCHGNSAGVAGNTLTPKLNGHGSATAKMLQTAYNAADTMTTAANFCYGCHGTTTAGGVTSPSIQAAVNLSASVGHKSVKCQDCHDQHSAKPGLHTAGPNSALAPVLNGVAGKGGWPATSPATATVWTGTGTLAVNYTAKPAATREYEICFKCHAGSVPAPTGYTAGALRMTDLGLEFNPNNKSGHPVVATLNNYGGSGTPKALLASDMVAPWTAVGTQTMTCGDCHGSGGSGAMGPHGSSVRWMLTGTNQAWPFTTTAGNGASTGTPWQLGTLTTGTAPNKLFCLNCHVVSGTNGVHDNVGTSGQHTSWKTTARAACISCHIRVPHGAKTARLLRLGTAAVLGRYAPDGNGAEVGTSTQQVLSKYTKGTQTSNRRGAFTGVGCSEHSGGTDTW